MRFLIELWIAKFILWGIKLIDKNRGSDLPGKLILKVDKNFTAKFKEVDPNKIIFITGTNGKSTTANLVNHVLVKNGYDVICNLEGSNLIAGITSALIKGSTLMGKIKADFVVFEVDERSLENIYSKIKCNHMVITNLQKDQVHRNGDPDFIYRKLERVANPDMTLYLNNEEPRSKSFEDFSSKVIYYSVEKNSDSFVKEDRLDVTMPCPKCSNKIDFEYYNVENVGKFKCEGCDFKSEDEKAVTIKNINFEAETFEFDGNTFNMPYNVPFMLYNYSLSIALCLNLGLNTKQINNAFSSFVNIGGRIETIQYKNKQLKYIRIKQENPETLQSALNVAASDKNEKTFILGLCLIKDELPFYTNTFYAFDCDFKPLIKSGLKRVICFSKHVCYDTANRFIYEGIDKNDIDILNTDDVSEILKKVDEAGCDNVYLITWLKTFNEIKQYVKANNL